MALLIQQQNDNLFERLEAERKVRDEKLKQSINSNISTQIKQVEKNLQTHIDNSINQLQNQMKETLRVMLGHLNSGISKSFEEKFKKTVLPVRTNSHFFLLFFIVAS